MSVVRPPRRWARRVRRLLGRGRDELGAVTVELALGMVSVAVVLMAVLGAAAAGMLAVRCQDAARAGARGAALGDDDAQVAALAGRVVGGAAAVDVARTDGWVSVQVSAPVLAAGSIRGWRVSATAVGRAEP